MCNSVATVQHCVLLMLDVYLLLGMPERDWKPWYLDKSVPLHVVK